MNNGKINWDPAGARVPAPDAYGVRTQIGHGRRGTYEWVQANNGLWSAYFTSHRTGKKVRLSAGSTAGETYRAITTHNRPGMAGKGRGA